MNFRLILLTSIVLSTNCLPVAQACNDDQARAAIHRLAQKSPAGYSLYTKTGSDPDSRKTFMYFLKNGYGGQCDLTTAVHEGAHVLNSKGQYHLISGATVPRVRDEAVFFPPQELYSKFKNFPESNYLKKDGENAPSSTTEFGFLLDEFNSYTWDAQVSLDLGSGLEAQGMLQFMQFVAAYIERAAQSNPATFNRLISKPTQTSVATLWAQAHDVLGNVCTQTGFTSPFLKGACAAAQNSSLAKVVGEKAHCPATCRGRVGVPGSSLPARPPSIIDYARPPKSAPPQPPPPSEVQVERGTVFFGIPGIINK